MINLDTHILIFALTGELRARERRLLTAQVWGISAIVLWELAKLVQLGRVEVDLADRTVRTTLNAIHTWPINLDVASESTRLDFKGDPADELIAATSVVYDVPLLTRDRQIRASKIVPLA